MEGYIAKTLYRTSKKMFPEMKLRARPRSQFPHSYFCERFIYSHDRSFYFAAENRRIYLRIYKSLTDTWMWKLEKLGRAVLFLRIHKSDVLCSVFRVQNRTRGICLSLKQEKERKSSLHRLKLHAVESNYSQSHHLFWSSILTCKTSAVFFEQQSKDRKSQWMYINS